MIRGLHTSFLGLQAAQRRADVTAHNIANLSTTGFKRQTVAVEQGHAAMQTQNSGPSFGATVTGPFTDVRAGALVPTGQLTDLAIEGEGYFSVQREGETLYTRNGAFVLDAEGYLATAAGDRILGENGHIQCGAGPIEVLVDGTVKVSGEVADKITIFSFTEPSALIRVGDDYYRQGDAEPQADTVSRVRQGVLEASNTDLATEFVDLIQASRAYTANIKAIQAEDELSDKAVNQVGVLR